MSQIILDSRSNKPSVGIKATILLLVISGLVGYTGWQINITKNEINRSSDNANKVAEQNEIIQKSSIAFNEELSTEPIEEEVTPSLPSLTEPSEYKCADVVEAIDGYLGYSCYDWPIFDDRGKPIIFPIPDPCDQFPILMENGTQRIYCLDYPQKKLVEVSEEVENNQLEIIEDQAVILESISTDLLE